LESSDPVHPRDTIAVMLEYNTLPTIVEVDFDFESKPYWLARQRAARAGDYRFPPHARLAISFSEPIDSASAFDGVRIYSVFDSLAAGSALSIGQRHAWENNYQRLLITPSYSAPSAYFGGLRPSDGMFIPADSISVELASSVVDRAATPSGPNGLDVDNDYRRDDDEIALRSVRVDSARLELLWTSPGADASGITPDAPIELRFSGPILPGTVDTALTDNRTLLITSRYLSRYDAARRLAYDSVVVDGARVRFYPARRFFFDDSVYCYYRGVSARDSLGYSVDIDRDGIPIHLFDSNAVADDYAWRFFTATVNQDSVFPPPDARGASPMTPVRIVFREPITAGMIDQSLVGNRSLIVSSRYSGGQQIDFASIDIDSTVATFTLDRRLFYDDSVHCVYSGLYGDDTSSYAIDPGASRYVTTRDDREWSFAVEELELIDVTPDSGSRGAPIDAAITMRFSGPISPLLFDTTTNAAANVSFRFLSMSAENGVSTIDSIVLARDSMAVTAYPSRTFFSGDSIACRFTGFSDHFRYAESGPFLPTDTLAVHGGYAWHFFAEDVRFYTYPNPFKPGADPRHRSLGGVWFKNLHALKEGMTDAIIRVYSMNTHPVFDSRKAGKAIHFVRGDPERKPEWLWDATNSRGAPLASGVYLYAVFDRLDPRKPLVKGKLLIVR
jgi:hypothetical protein